MKQIKIITAIDRIPVTDLEGMTRISKTGIRLPSGLNWQPLQVKRYAQLTISDKVEDKNVVWTAKLQFKTCDMPDAHGRWAYRCRLTDGRYRLIGSYERPYPVVTVQENMPENVTDNQLNDFTVNWQSTRFIPYIQD